MKDKIMIVSNNETFGYTQHTEDLGIVPIENNYIVTPLVTSMLIPYNPFLPESGKKGADPKTWGQNHKRKHKRK